MTMTDVAAIARGPCFICIACKRKVEPVTWTTMRDRDVPPICYRCEVEHTTVSVFPSARFVGKPMGGTHMDRRQAMRLYAMADALETTARQMKWNNYAAA